MYDSNTSPLTSIGVAHPSDGYLYHVDTYKASDLDSSIYSHGI